MTKTPLLPNPLPPDCVQPIRVVMFCGGSGSGVLSSRLVADPAVRLTLAINGYDDGASTGAIRRFLGRCLGPSDFRKNASRLARDLDTCPQALIDLVEHRLPSGVDDSAVLGWLDGRDTGSPEMTAWKRSLPEQTITALDQCLAHVHARITDGHAAPDWGDCSVGNILFAGCVLHAGGDFNAAVADYAGLLGLDPELILNVTDGTDAYLAALTHDGQLLTNEEQIVDRDSPNQIDEILLLDHRPTQADAAATTGMDAATLRRHFEPTMVKPAANQLLLEKIAAADLILYAPGTQHSSLFPSYLTEDVGTAIAENLKAIKVLITNIHEDAEIRANSAQEIVARALRYLRQRDELQIPTPFLITHYLVNDPGHRDDESAGYVPLGRLQSTEDPRLVRIGHFEDGVSGRHDASAVLTPFIEAVLEARRRVRVAVLMHGTTSADKVSQSLLEMVRAGVMDVAVDLQVYVHGVADLTDTLPAMPFDVICLDGELCDATTADGIRECDYVLCFESSSRYRGDDIVNVASLLLSGTLDAVWGSRRLSINDIHRSYQLRYRHHRLMGAVSYLGSHLLSLTYLILYGRYVSDTLSGVWAVRPANLGHPQIDLDDACVTQQVLSLLLRHRAEILETPIQYFTVTPDEDRTSRVGSGIRAFLTILRWRLRRLLP